MSQQVNKSKIKRMLLSMITRPREWSVQSVMVNNSFCLQDSNIEILFYGHTDDMIYECNGHIRIKLDDSLEKLVKEVKDFWRHDLTRVKFENAKKLNKEKSKLNNLLEKY
jgi:hypothetical protein